LFPGCGLLRAQAPAGPDAPAPSVFAVERFEFAYGAAADDPATLAPLRDITVPLSLAGGVYQAPAAGAPAAPVRLGGGFPGGRFSESALVSIFQAVAAHYNRLGLFGVFVVVDRDDIDPQTHEDYRPAARTALRLVVWVSRVSEVRSVAKGTRVPPRESIGNRIHRNILSHSPLQAGKGGAPGSPFLKKRLDNYLLDLNRHPARRVDASFAAGATPGEVTLDYLVAERRPWFAYVQVSNSGSDVTDDFREHLGFAYYQLANRDDTLLLDLSTASFKGGFSASASYDFPLLYPNTLRAKISGAYSEFASEDLGFDRIEKFSGHSVAAGLELVWSPFRLLGFSVDFAPGLTWQTHYVNNTITPPPTETDFAAGQFALRLERNTEHMRTALRLTYETNFGGDTRFDLAGQQAIGRLETKPGYKILQFDLSHSMHMEPLLFGEKFYTGENWRKSARAHEIALTARGQQVVNHERIIPQKQMTVGGMYSVRGYPDSVAAGDHVVMGSLEYRLHVPRLFRPYSELARDRGDARPPAYFGIPFNWRAPGLHSLPDWDFVVRLFADAGRVKIIRRMSWERNLTLSSIGAGFETQLFGHLNLRCDWGFAQKPLRTSFRDINRWDSRLHCSASLLW
jgi:hemolysin activation/secretion protein